MSAQIYKMKKRPLTLAHESHLYQRMSVRADLPRRLHSIEDVTKKTRMGEEAMTIVETCKIPRNPCHAAHPFASADDCRGIRVFDIDMHELRRADHGRRNQRQGMWSSCLDRGEWAV